MKPVLVTITAPSAGGKSYLFNFIRDVAKLPCLISTTTRAPRAGEVDGVDYYFISDEESKGLEEANQLAELAIYRGIRYGVTKQEFHGKLSDGLAFLIVEPSGIEHYVQPALDVGALHLNVFVQTPLEIRLKRFNERARNDMIAAVANGDDPLKVQTTNLNRLEAILTVEETWPTIHEWDLVISGEEKPEVNLELILIAVERLRVRNG
jgi:guanylate kinase